MSTESNRVLKTEKILPAPTASRTLTSLKDILFWGATGQCKVLHEFIGSLGYRLVAVFDNDPAVTAPIDGIPLYHGETGFRTWLGQKRSEPVWGLVAVGGARGRIRLRLQDYLGAQGIRIATAVHPSAYVAATSVLGQGCQVLAHATICTQVVLGDGCIINTAASVDHESILGAGVHVAPGATLTGCVHVGEGSFIGAGAVVLPRLRIGTDTVVGAGAVVTRDLPDGVVAYGNPARIVRNNRLN